MSVLIEVVKRSCASIVYAFGRVQLDLTVMMFAGSNTARFLTVLSDGLDNVSSTSAATAMSALESCSVPNFFPILVSAGAAGAYDSMRARNATYIQVGSTSDSDLRQAFKEVTGELLQLLLSAAATNGVPVAAPQTCQHTACCFAAAARTTCLLCGSQAG